MVVVDRVMLKLEVLTPLFFGGAKNQRSSVDAFRIPSLRGLARFWFRALMGGVIGSVQDNLKLVRQLEGEVFGSTEQASAVQFRLLSSPPHPEYKVQGDSGTGYLGFSLKNRVGLFPTDRGDKIEVAVECRPGASEAEEQLLLALGALWLLTNFGGLGSRSRRGFGSVAVVSVEPKTVPRLPSFLVQGGNSKELASSLSEGLKKVWMLYSEYARPNQSGGTSSWQKTTLPKYDIFAKGVARVKVASFNAPRWKDVLNELGQKLRDYRRSANDQQRQIFGLPYPSNARRRASPLFFKVVRFSTGNYGAVLTLFKAEFLPTGRGDNRDYKILDKFLDDVDGDEVSLP